MDAERVAGARAKDPRVGLVPCRGPECPQWENDGWDCILLHRQERVRR